MKYFSEIYGLVTKNDKETENGGLFLAEYLTLKDMLNEPIPTDIEMLFWSKMDKSYVSEGLYKRSETHTERTVSNDEITGMIVSSHLLYTPHGNSIARYLSDNFGNYPATGTNKRYNPADFFAWFKLSNRSLLANLFAPFYLINLLITSNREKQNTSSKLMYLIELHCLKDVSFIGKYMHKYFTWRMKKMYGDRYIKELFSIYFHSEDSDHPLIELSSKL